MNMTTPPPLLASRMARTMTRTFRPTPENHNRRAECGVTEETLGELTSLTNHGSMTKSKRVSRAAAVGFGGVPITHSGGATVPSLKRLCL